MSRKQLANFRLSDQTRHQLEVCRGVVGSTKTKVLEAIIANAYEVAVRKLPEKVKAVEAEMEQNANEPVR